MPQAIGWVAAAVVKWWAGMSLAAKIWFVVRVAATVYAVSYAAQQRKKLANAMRSAGALDPGRAVMVRDSIVPRNSIYGEDKTSGPWADFFFTGTNNEYLHIVLVLAGRELTSIDTIYWGDEVVPLDGSGNATGTYAGYMRIKKHLGATDQTADADLVSESGGRWTTDHKGQGVAYLYIRIKWNADLFPDGVRNISAVVHGSKVYDPRAAGSLAQDPDDPATWTFSENSALCLADYLHAPASLLGLDIPTDEIDQTELIAAANECDEEIALAGSGMGTEARYRTDGPVVSDSTPEDVVNHLCGAMAGTCVYSGGLWFIQAGASRASSLTLTNADFVGPVTTSPRLSRRDLCNRVMGTYMSAAEGYVAVSVPPVVNATYLTEDGEEEIWHDIELPYTNSASAAQRLFKIDLERTRQQIVVSLTCSLKAMQCRAGDVVALTYATNGWTAKEFEVVEWKLNPPEDEANPVFTVGLTLRETAAAVWDWNSGEETTVDLAPDTTLWDSRVTPTPSGLTLSTSNFAQNDGTVSPRLKLVWTAPADQFVLSGGRVEVEYKKNADSDYIVWSTLRGNIALDYITDVQAGVAYDARIRFQNAAGVFGAYQTVTNYTVTADSTAPATPSGLTATATTGAVTLDWTDNSEADLDLYKVYRYATDTPASATLIGTVSASRFVDTRAPAGTSYYWVTAVDRTNNESAKSTEAHAAPGGAASVESAAVPTAGDGFTNEGEAPYIIGVDTPTGAGTGYSLAYSKGGAAWVTAYNFPFNLTMASAGETIEFVANDTGKAPSEKDSASWTSLFA